MSRYHSTMSRREFMKVLGLGGAGLATAAIAPPVFHDLDEVKTSPQATWKRPSWVKEVDKPTCEIDWTRMDRFDGSFVQWIQPSFIRAVGQTQADAVTAMSGANRLLWIKQNKPGYTQRDYAMRLASAGVLGVAPTQTFLGPRTAPTPESMGLPRYEGTPEENAKMVRAFMRVRGASEVSFLELDTETTEKILYKCDSAKVPYLIQDAEQPEEKLDPKGTSYRIVPKKARYVISYAMRMPDELFRRTPGQFGAAASQMIYDQQCMLQCWLQQFTRALGYNTMGWHMITASLGSSTGFGVMSGLGEIGRTMHLITPEHGQTERVFSAITDLPLAPGKPVDFGATRFCEQCKKCADLCPASAIPPSTKPAWEPNAFYHRGGVRMWYRDEGRCRAYQYVADGCNVCSVVCPFSKLNKAPYHDIARSVTAATPAFNRFFRKMDDFLGYNVRAGDDTEKFWDLDLPPWGQE